MIYRELSNAWQISFPAYWCFASMFSCTVITCLSVASSSSCDKYLGSDSYVIAERETLGTIFHPIRWSPRGHTHVGAVSPNILYFYIGVASEYQKILPAWSDCWSGLMFSMPDNFQQTTLWNIFLIFPRKKGLTFHTNYNLHVIAVPVFCGKKKEKYYKFVVCWVCQDTL